MVGDWILDNMLWILGALLVLCVWGLYVISSACQEKQVALIAECVKDGKPNYECVAKFQKFCSSDTTVVPVYIPMGR